MPESPESSSSPVSDDPPGMNRQHDSPDSSVHGNTAPVQRVDHHDHGSKTLATLAVVLSSAAIGGLVIAVPLILLLIKSEIAAGKAEAVASVQQQAALAQATATAGNQHARVALDKVEDFRAKLAAKGIDIPPLDGH